jgi:hypothetical protein
VQDVKKCHDLFLDVLTGFSEHFAAASSPEADVVAE